MSLIVFFSSLLLQVFLCCDDGEAAVTEFISKPSDKSFATETFNITLEWSYTVNGAISSSRFINVTNPGNAVVIALWSAGGTNINSNLQERFRADISDSQAQLTFLTVQRSYEGMYRFTLTDTVNFKVIIHDVEVIVQYPPSITDISGNQTVTVGDVVTLNCTADGRPTPNITWTKLSNNSVVEMPLNITGTEDEGTYRCTADNGVGNPVSRNVSITVQIPPEIVNVSSDRVVCEGSTVTLSCNANGKPTPNITWTRAFDNGTESALLPVVDGKYVINNTVRSSNGTYRCTADNGVDDGPVNRTVRLTFGYFAPVAIANSSNTVNEGGPFNMTCEATGDPMPNVHWIKVDNGQRIDRNILNFTNINRNDAGQYRCEAENECGSDSRVQSVKVNFGPSATDVGQNITVGIGKSRSLGCPVDGNPKPTITWYNASGTVIYSRNTLNFSSTKSSDTGCYTCSANNFLGTCNVTHCLVVELVSPTVTSPTVTSTTATSPTTSQDDSQDVKVTLTIKDKDCTNNPVVKEVEQKFCIVVTSNVSRFITAQLNGVGMEDCKVKNVGCGSVIVDFVLRFNQSVTADEVVSALKAAAKDGKFGSYNVDPKSIKQTSSSPTQGSPCKDSLFKDTECDLKVIILVIFGVCGVLVIACVVGGAIYYWVHKRKQCRKDTRIHNSDDQQALQGNHSGAEEGAYSQVNGGYADSGPPSANGTGAAEQQPREGANGTDAPVQQQQQAQGAPPTYAVVNKSTKKQKKEEEKINKAEEKKMKEEEKRMKEEEKKNKNDAEQNIPQYAVVDKSQKKKKEEVVEDAYAQVNMSKKSKKKPKPSEMLYADLGDFKPREMPAVSTSPNSLPPIKRSPAYEETQYADITQFMKGDATLPDTNNSQGTEMTHANVEGGKEKPKDTANEGGNEEKPKETRM